MFILAVFGTMPLILLKEFGAKLGPRLLRLTAGSTKAASKSIYLVSQAPHDPF